MNDPKTSPEQAPGHYGAGYGEQVPENAPPQPAPATDQDAPAVEPVAQVERTVDGPGGSGDLAGIGQTTLGDDGAPVVFTPADISARPPDHPPTESAPESEKAGLIFERS